MEGPQHTKSNQNYISSLPIPTIINLLLPSFMKEIFLERHLFNKRNIKKKNTKKPHTCDGHILSRTHPSFRMETTLNVWKQICDSDILGRTPHNVYCEWQNSLHQNFVLYKKNICHEISSLIKYNMYQSEKLGWKPWNNMLQK